jgi:hypothetical protein
MMSLLSLAWTFLVAALMASARGLGRCPGGGGVPVERGILADSPRSSRQEEGGREADNRGTPRARDEVMKA